MRELWAEYLDKADAKQIEKFAKTRLAVDLIFGHSLRETENGWLKKSRPIGKRLREGTFPWEIEDLLKDCGIEVDEKSYYLTQNEKDLQKIEAVVAKGQIVMVFENHGITDIAPEEGKFGILGIHYITLHKFAIKGDMVEFSYWDYGTIKADTKTVKVFLNGMKGYWIPEAPAPLEEEENNPNLEKE